MASFAILVSSFAILVLSNLVVSQEKEACAAEKCGFSAPKIDVTSMVQLNGGRVGQSSSVNTMSNHITLAAAGESCQAHCGGQEGGADACDTSKMQTIAVADINSALAAVGQAPCSSVLSLSGLPGSPLVELSSQTGAATCFPNAGVASCSGISIPQLGFPRRRLCACLSNSADTEGDPHIHSFLGAHYTVLQQGIFNAWNFSKTVPGPRAATAEWQLLAAYAGNRFTVQGLLLLDRHAGQSMEITAEDCSWRVKEKTSPWRKAQVELLSTEDGTTSFQVKKLQEKVGETKIQRSAIMLQMKSGLHDMKNTAQLVVHCTQGHLDFKMTMFERSDINHVGGELGVAPDANHNYHFLFGKQGMMQMRADQEFKAPGSWLTLGGSPSGTAYLEKQQLETSLTQVSQSCTDADEDSAKSTCSKHLQETTHPETFADCVYDLCHGGDESFAQSAAALLLPP